MSLLQSTLDQTKTNLLLTWLLGHCSQKKKNTMKKRRTITLFVTKWRGITIEVDLNEIWLFVVHHIESLSSNIIKHGSIEVVTQLHLLFEHLWESNKSKVFYSKSRLFPVSQSICLCTFLTSSHCFFLYCSTFLFNRTRSFLSIHFAFRFSAMVATVYHAAVRKEKVEMSAGVRAADRTLKHAWNKIFRQTVTTPAIVVTPEQPKHKHKSHHRKTKSYNLMGSISKFETKIQKSQFIVYVQWLFVTPPAAMR